MAERDYVVLEFIGHSRKVGVQATAVTQQFGWSAKDTAYYLKKLEQQYNLIGRQTDLDSENPQRANRFTSRAWLKRFTPATGTEEEAARKDWSVEMRKNCVQHVRAMLATAPGGILASREVYASLWEKYYGRMPEVAEYSRAEFKSKNKAVHERLSRNGLIQVKVGNKMCFVLEDEPAAEAQGASRPSVPRLEFLPEDEAPDVPVMLCRTLPALDQLYHAACDNPGGLCIPTMRDEYGLDSKFREYAQRQLQRMGCASRLQQAGAGPARSKNSMYVFRVEGVTPEPAAGAADGSAGSTALVVPAPCPMTSYPGATGKLTRLLSEDFHQRWAAILERLEERPVMEFSDLFNWLTERLGRRMDRHTVQRTLSSQRNAGLLNACNVRILQLNGITAVRLLIYAPHLTPSSPEVAALVKALRNNELSYGRRTNRAPTTMEPAEQPAAAAAALKVPTKRPSIVMNTHRCWELYNGFCVPRFARAQKLHQYLWDLARSRLEATPNAPASTALTLYAIDVMHCMPVGLYCEVIGCRKQVPHMADIAATPLTDLCSADKALLQYSRTQTAWRLYINMKLLREMGLVDLDDSTSANSSTVTYTTATLHEWGELRKPAVEGQADTDDPGFVSFAGRYHFWDVTELQRYWGDYQFAALQMAEEDRAYLHLLPSALMPKHWFVDCNISAGKRNRLDRFRSQHPALTPELVTQASRMAKLNVITTFRYLTQPLGPQQVVVPQLRLGMSGAIDFIGKQKWSRPPHHPPRPPRPRKRQRTDAPAPPADAAVSSSSSSDDDGDNDDDDKDQGEQLDAAKDDAAEEQRRMLALLAGEPDEGDAAEEEGLAPGAGGPASSRGGPLARTPRLEYQEVLHRIIVEVAMVKEVQADGGVAPHSVVDWEQAVAALNEHLEPTRLKQTVNLDVFRLRRLVQNFRANQAHYQHAQHTIVLGAIAKHIALDEGCSEEEVRQRVSTVVAEMQGTTGRAGFDEALDLPADFNAVQQQMRFYRATREQFLRPLSPTEARMADILRLIVLTPEESWDGRCGFDLVSPTAWVAPNIAKALQADGVLTKRQARDGDPRRLRGYMLGQRFLERCCPQLYYSSFFDQAVQCAAWWQQSQCTEAPYDVLLDYGHMGGLLTLAAIGELHLWPAPLPAAEGGEEPRFLADDFEKETATPLDVLSPVTFRRSRATGFLAPEPLRRDLFHGLRPDPPLGLFSMQVDAVEVPEGPPLPDALWRPRSVDANEELDGQEKDLASEEDKKEGRVDAAADPSPGQLALQTEEFPELADLNAYLRASHVGGVEDVRRVYAAVVAGGEAGLAVPEVAAHPTGPPTALTHLANFGLVKATYHQHTVRYVASVRHPTLFLRPFVPRRGEAGEEAVTLARLLNERHAPSASAPLPACEVATPRPSTSHPRRPGRQPDGPPTRPPSPPLPPHSPPPSPAAPADPGPAVPAASPALPTASQSSAKPPPAGEEGCPDGSSSSDEAEEALGTYLTKLGGAVDGQPELAAEGEPDCGPAVRRAGRKRAAPNPSDATPAKQPRITYPATPQGANYRHMNVRDSRGRLAQKRRPTDRQPPTVDPDPRHAVSITSWMQLDGAVNFPFVVELRRTVYALLMNSPGMPREALQRHFVNHLHPSAVDALLDAMVADEQLVARWHAAPPAVTLRTALADFLGESAAAQPREAFFVNTAALFRLC
eukprot:EG_transcript_205